MDQATTWFYASQSEESKRREAGIGARRADSYNWEARSALPWAAISPMRRPCRTCRPPHAGVLYGMAASALIRKGARPLTAGLAIGTLAYVLVDEGTAISQVTD